MIREKKRSRIVFHNQPDWGIVDLFPSIFDQLNSYRILKVGLVFWPRKFVAKYMEQTNLLMNENANMCNHK